MVSTPGRTNPTGHQGDRAGAARGTHRRGRQARARQDDAVGAELQERFERHRLDSLIQVAAGDQHLVAAGGSSRGDAVEDLGKEQVVQIGDDHADVEGAALDQAARDGVGTVAERLDGDQDGLAAGGTDGRVIAQNARDDRLGDAGVGGDVDDGGRAVGGVGGGAWAWLDRGLGVI